MFFDVPDNDAARLESIQVRTPAGLTAEESHESLKRVTMLATSAMQIIRASDELSGLTFLELVSLDMGDFVPDFESCIAKPIGDFAADMAVELEDYITHHSRTPFNAYYSDSSFPMSLKSFESIVFCTAFIGGITKIVITDEFKKAAERNAGSNPKSWARTEALIEAIKAISASRIGKEGALTKQFENWVASEPIFKGTHKLSLEVISEVIESFSERVLSAAKARGEFFKTIRPEGLDESLIWVP